jgi:glycosyltransferase involved in cell wall biosynthesis
VRQQKFEDFEVIVVDDGSTDDTKEMLRSYGDRTRYVFQENRRPSAARNLGVGLAKSRWIAIQWMMRRAPACLSLLPNGKRAVEKRQ